MSWKALGCWLEYCLCFQTSEIAPIPPLLQNGDASQPNLSITHGKVSLRLPCLMPIHPRLINLIWDVANKMERNIGSQMPVNIWQDLFLLSQKKRNKVRGFPDALELVGWAWFSFFHPIRVFSTEATRDVLNSGFLYNAQDIWRMAKKPGRRSTIMLNISHIFEAFCTMPKGEPGKNKTLPLKCHSTLLGCNNWLLFLH